MPWISEELCTGCQLCLDECCVGAIVMDGDLALIHEDECIRCGVCHDVCPSDAIRHDSDRIPAEVQANLAYARELLQHEYYAGDKLRQKQLVTRLQRHFAKNEAVAAKTVEQLALWQNTQYQ